MSAQRLSPRSVRRIERATGQPIVRAWSHGGYVFPFVVADPERPDGHRHGWYDKHGSGSWGWADDPPRHYTSCRDELFAEAMGVPDDPRWGARSGVAADV